VIEVAPAANGRPLLADAARELANRGLTRILVEGGGRLAAGLLGAGLVDRVICFRAPRIIGGDGIAVIGDLGLEALTAAFGFVRTDVREIGVDLLEFYRRRD
jgi:diaminohydroxyphosphoribosylaminopyrimidine deaminase/5-amino-6-(5-phosphoribosylamino)uracil reductase